MMCFRFKLEREEIPAVTPEDFERDMAEMATELTPKRWQPAPQLGHKSVRPAQHGTAEVLAFIPGDNRRLPRTSAPPAPVRFKLGTFGRQPKAKTPIQ